MSNPEANSNSNSPNEPILSTASSETSSCLEDEGIALLDNKTIQQIQEMNDDLTDASAERWAKARELAQGQSEIPVARGRIKDVSIGDASNTTLGKFNILQNVNMTMAAQMNEMVNNSTKLLGK